MDESTIIMFGIFNTNKTEKEKINKKNILQEIRTDALKIICRD